MYFYQPVADLLITSAAIYWPCQPADLSVTPTVVMMKSYQMFMVCVVLCTVQSVHSYSIRATITDRNLNVQEVNVSHYIRGENWITPRVLTLDRLEGAETLLQLTIVNFQHIHTFNLMNIALENVPVFVNTTCRYMHILENKIKSVPTNAFSGLQPYHLDLSNNEIQTMADRSVNIEAEQLYLRCNKLNHFSQTWFQNPGRIKFLDLSGNRIGHIQDRAFNRMINLNILYLNYNHIISIGSAAFSSGIRYLYLGFTNITRLTVDMFAHRDKSMSDLFLHHNQLSYLPEALLLKLKPKRIALFGNPWQCQCLRDIERWLRELNSMQHDIPTRRGEPVCVVPLSFQNVCVPTVDTESQQTYARGLSPLPECLASKCKLCNGTEDLYLVELT